MPRCGRCSRASCASPRETSPSLRRGQVVKHGLPSRAPGEIAVAGAVRIRAPKAAFFARVRDIARFKSGPAVLQIGRFSNPPVLDDLAALTVDKDDFDVRSCRVGDCGIRLPAAVIERLAREIDLKAPDAQARGAALFKQTPARRRVGVPVRRRSAHDPVRRRTEADSAARRVRRDPGRHAGDRRAGAGPARSPAALSADPGCRTPRIFCTGRRRSSASRRSSPSRTSPSSADRARPA